MRYQPPDYWTVPTFKEVAKVTTGTTPPKINPENYGGSVPFVGPAELDQEEPITCASSTLSELGVENSRLLPTGSVLVCCIGSLGKVGIAGVPLVTNQQINALTFNEKRVLPRYGYHYCKTLKPLLEHMAPSTTVAIVNKGNFQELQIPLPPLSEQRRIVEILDLADETRRNQQEIIRLTEEALRSAFLEMFGDPVTNPMGWEVRKLSDVIEIASGQVHPQESPYNQMLHVGGDNIESETGRLYGMKTAVELNLISGKYKFDDTWILYSKIRPYLNKVVIPSFEGICSADIYPIRPQKNTISKEFLAMLLRSKPFLAYAETQSTRTSIPKINRKDLLKYEAPMPFLHETPLHERFQSLFITNRELISCSEEALRQLDTLFDSLVQAAFRGELTADKKKK